MEHLATADIGTWLGALDLQAVAYPGLITLMIILIFRGWLHTDRNCQASKWEKAHHEMAEANKELMAQNTKLIEAGRTTQRVVQAIPEVGGGSS